MTVYFLDAVATAVGEEVYRQYRENSDWDDAKEVIECLDYVNLASVALHAADTRRGWRPIETAPRDGQKFLIWDGWHICLASYEMGKYLATHGKTDDTRRPSEPSHWMPLPEAPV